MYQIFKKYIKPEYSAKELGIEGDFVFQTMQNSSVYNAKYFGAPTNRKRFICGDFPALELTHNDNNVVPLEVVLNSLALNGDSNQQITDCNYPTLTMPANMITDHNYVREVQPFEWRKAKRLKTG